MLTLCLLPLRVGPAKAKKYYQLGLRTTADLASSDKVRGSFTTGLKAGSQLTLRIAGRERSSYRRKALRRP